MLLNLLLPKKLLKILLLSLIFSFVFVSPAKAFLNLFGADPNTMLNSLEELVGPIANKAQVSVLLGYVIGWFLFYMATKLLAIAIQPQWLTISDNFMVVSAWSFVSGIANMIIVIALVVIAFGYILKIESIQAKRALPRLIIAALLINFSLLFVSMLTDISKILVAAILAAFPEGPDKFFENIFNSLTGGALPSYIFLVSSILGLLACFLIPGYIAVLCQSGVVAVGLTLGLPLFLNYLFTIFSFFLLASIFFIYAFLFAARVFVIQLLAILSPIAAVCAILPQTKKFWDEWWHHFMQWLWLGFILLFFLVIGLRVLTFMQPPVSVQTPIVNFLFVHQLFAYYFFLFIYLVIALWLSQRFMPDIANILIQQGKAAGSFMWKSGVKPLIAKPMAEQIRSRVMKFREQHLPPKDKIENWAQSESKTRKLQALVAEQMRQVLQKDAYKRVKFETPTELLYKLNSGISNYERALLIMQAIEKGGEYKEIALSYLTNEKNHEKALNALIAARKIGDKNAVITLGRALGGMGTFKKIVENIDKYKVLQETGIITPEEAAKRNINEDTLVQRLTGMNFSSLFTGKDAIKQLDKTAFTNPEVIKSFTPQDWIYLFRNNPQIIQDILPTIISDTQDKSLDDIVSQYEGLIRALLYSSKLSRGLLLPSPSQLFSTENRKLNDQQLIEKLKSLEVKRVNDLLQKAKELSKTQQTSNEQTNKSSETSKSSENSDKKQSTPSGPTDPKGVSDDKSGYIGSRGTPADSEK